MSVDIFYEQVQLYKEGDHTDFRRISLVYAFQDIVNALETRADITPKIIQSIDSLLSLQQTNSSLFTEISPDLLESTIRLQILLAPQFPKALTQLSIALATYSKALEFQKELSSIMTLLKSSESSHPFEQFRNSQGPESKDIFKTVITFYIPIILRMLEDCELKEGIKNLIDYLEFIKIDVHEFNAALGSELIPEIFQVLSERRKRLKSVTAKETLVFLLELLEIYRSIGIFKEHRNELVGTIANIFGDFDKVLGEFLKFNVQAYGPFSVVVSAAVKGKVGKLALHYVLSPARRLQIYAPVAVMCGDPNTRDKVLSFCSFYVSEISPWLVTSRFSKFHPLKFYLAFLDSVFERPGKSLKKSKGVFRMFFNKFRPEMRVQVVEKIVGKVQAEEKLSFLVRLLISAGEVMYSNGVVSYLAKLRPVINYILVFRSLSKYLNMLNAVKSVKTCPFYEEIKELYSELLCNLDNEIPKIKDILMSFRNVL